MSAKLQLPVAATACFLSSYLLLTLFGLVLFGRLGLTGTIPAWCWVLLFVPVQDQLAQSGFLWQTVLGTAILCLVGPIVWLSPWQRLRRWAGQRPDLDVSGSRWADWCCPIFCGLLGLGLAAWYGWPLRHLPPLWHDEYSYLFQAQTFLSGRLSVPSPTLARAFAQVHLVDTGEVWCSRYFPGTGVWLLPFVWLGWPGLSGWLTAGLLAGWTARLGRRGSPLTGWLAGLATATAPGLLLLSQHLLSTLPTMLLALWFLDAFWLALERRSRAYASLAGLCIGLAFLTRPLTAVGIGLPFALWSLWSLARHWSPESRRLVGWLLIGFVPCVVLLAGFNWATMGTIWQSPYSWYIQHYTPKHVFGFYNQDWGAEHAGPLVQTAYDNWSENLTPTLAWHKLHQRVGRLWFWSLGHGISLALLPMMAWYGWRKRLDWRYWALWSGVLGLALAYFPYWFEGLLGFSYLAEILPWWVLLASLPLATLVQTWWQTGRPRLAVTLLLPSLAAICLHLGWIVPTLLGQPGSEYIYPRLQAARIETMLSRWQQQDGPILVLIRVGPQPPIHQTLVWNEPTLTAPILRVWEHAATVAQFRQQFPQRTIYWLDVTDPDRPTGGRLEI